MNLSLNIGTIFLYNLYKCKKMNNFFKTLLAGYAGWKWGGGCLGTIVVFVIVYYLLGYAHC